MVKIPNRQKSNKLSSSSGTSQDANLKSPISCISTLDKTSDRASLHQKEMIRKRPLQVKKLKKEVD